MAEYGEWNRKGAVLSDVTAQKEYGVTRDFIVKGVQAGELEFREGAVWGNCASPRDRWPNRAVSRRRPASNGRPATSRLNRLAGIAVQKSRIPLEACREGSP